MSDDGPVLGALEGSARQTRLARGAWVDFCPGWLTGAGPVIDAYHVHHPGGIVDAVHDPIGTAPSEVVSGQFAAEQFARHGQILGGRGDLLVVDELDEFAALEVERRVADADEIGFDQQLGGDPLAVDIGAVMAAKVDDLLAAGG